MSHQQQHYDASDSDDESDGEHEQQGHGGRAAGNRHKPRVSKACDACRQSRRKCNGEQPCSICLKRGVECTFDENPSKKRGPKPRQQRLEEENQALRAEVEQLRAAAAGGGLASSTSRSGSSNNLVQATVPPAQQAPRPAPSRSLLPYNVWGLPGPIVPSPEETRTLRTVFDFTNRILPAVDEDYFYAALEEARYIVPTAEEGDGEEGAAGRGDEGSEGAGGQSRAAKRGARGGGRPTVQQRRQSVPAATASAGGRGEGAPSDGAMTSDAPFLAVARNSEMFGFRVCYYTLLCIGARIMDKVDDAKRYYELARAYIGPCYTQPSQHLVSALLLMTMITRAMCQDSNQAALHAALALRMSELVEVSPEIRMVAIVFNSAHSPSASVWPAAHAPAAQPAHLRFAEILGFLISQLIRDFPALESPKGTAAPPPAPSSSSSSPHTADSPSPDGVILPAQRDALLSLLDEALGLQASQGLFRGFPMVSLGWGVRGLLLQRTGETDAALDAAKLAIDAARGDKLAIYCFPCVFAISRLLGMVRFIAVSAGWLPAGAGSARDCPAMLRAAEAFAAASERREVEERAVVGGALSISSAAEAGAGAGGLKLDWGKAKALMRSACMFLTESSAHGPHGAAAALMCPGAAAAAAASRNLGAGAGPLDDAEAEEGARAEAGAVPYRSGFVCPGCGASPCSCGSPFGGLEQRTGGDSAVIDHLAALMVCATTRCDGGGAGAGGAFEPGTEPQRQPATSSGRGAGAAAGVQRTGAAGRGAPGPSGEPLELRRSGAVPPRKASAAAAAVAGVKRSSEARESLSPAMNQMLHMSAALAPKVRRTADRTTAAGGAATAPRGSGGGDADSLVGAPDLGAGYYGAPSAGAGGLLGLPRQPSAAAASVPVAAVAPYGGGGHQQLQALPASAAAFPSGLLPGLIPGLMAVDSFSSQREGGGGDDDVAAPSAGPAPTMLSSLRQASFFPHQPQGGEYGGAAPASYALAPRAGPPPSSDFKQPLQLPQHAPSTHAGRGSSTDGYTTMSADSVEEVVRRGSSSAAGAPTAIRAPGAALGAARLPSAPLDSVGSSSSTPQPSSGHSQQGGGGGQAASSSTSGSVMSTGGADDYSLMFHAAFGDLSREFEGLERGVSIIDHPPPSLPLLDPASGPNPVAGAAADAFRAAPGGGSAAAAAASVDSFLTPAVVGQGGAGAAGQPLAGLGLGIFDDDAGSVSSMGLHLGDLLSRFPEPATLINY